MNETAFSFDPDWMGTLTAPFMTNAFLAGLCIALAAGVMGYFTIARHSTFAAHALAHIGLPGATGAVLLGLPVSAGLGVFALGGALVIGALGKKASQREIATGTVLAFATGMGLFFARLSSSASQQMQSILFGSILTITDGRSSDLRFSTCCCWPFWPLSIDRCCSARLMNRWRRQKACR